MKNITIKTAVEERNAVMGDYGINPGSTGWTLFERNRQSTKVASHCRTRRQARAMWLEIFQDMDQISEVRFTDAAILTAEAEFLTA